MCDITKSIVQQSAHKFSFDLLDLVITYISLYYLIIWTGLNSLPNHHSSNIQTLGASDTRVFDFELNHAALCLIGKLSLSSKIKIKM